MDHFVQRTTQHHSPRHSYQRPPRPPVAQETLMSSASTSSADASGGNAFTSFAVQPLSDVASMHEQDHDNDDHDHDHGIDTLIDSLPESVLRKVLKSVAHLSTIQEALSTASTLSAPSSPAFDSSLSASSPSSAVPTQASPSPSAEATELRATSSVGTVSRLDVYYPDHQSPRHSPTTRVTESSFTPTRSRVKRAASLSPTRSPSPQDQLVHHRRPPPPMLMVRKPTPADARASAPMTQSTSREASPHRHFARHTEVRRGYLRQASHYEGTVSTTANPREGAGRVDDSIGSRSSGSRSSGTALLPVSQQPQHPVQPQQPQALLNNIRRGLLQLIHRANLYYHGTLDTKDAVISLLNVANFALDPNAVLIKSPASQRARPGESTSRLTQHSVTETGIQRRRDPYDQSPLPSLPYSQHLPSRQYQQQPSPMTPQLSRAGTHLSMTQSPSQGPSLVPLSSVPVDPIRESSPVVTGGRASLLPTPHASPSISSAGPGFVGASQRPPLDEAMSRIVRQGRGGRIGQRNAGAGVSTMPPSRSTTSSTMTSKPSPSSLSSAAQSQPHPQQQRGIVPISHEILSSLTMILLHHPSQKQRQVEANQPGGKTAVYQGRAATDDETTAMSATEDGCDLEDWLLEAVYNLLEHETYKGQVMAETLGEYIVRVALARERRYRSQRSRYEQQQQQQSQSQQRIYPEYHGIREHERQRLEDDEDDQVQVEEGQDFPNEEVETGYDEVEDHPEQLPVDGSFEAQDVEAELDRAQEEEVEVGEDEEEDEHAYPPRDVDPSNQRAGDSLSHDRPLAYSLYHHARFRWSQGVEGSSDVGDVPTSDIAAAPSELASELATDMQLSEPPTELGEPIKLVMLSEDCFGARAGPGDDGSVGNESFRRLRGPVEDGDDDDDDHDDGDHGEGDDHEEDSTLAVASHTGAAGHPNRRMLAPKEIEELAEQPPSDLPYEVHDISRIDLGSDLGPLIQELAEDKDLEDLYPLDPAASPQDGEDDQEARLQDHGLMFLATTENIAPPPSEDWA